jgi:hypothetical protein
VDETGRLGIHLTTHINACGKAVGDSGDAQS